MQNEPKPLWKRIGEEQYRLDHMRAIAREPYADRAFCIKCALASRAILKDLRRQARK